MKKICLILLLLLLGLPLYPAEVSHDLRQAVQILTNFPDGRRILDEVEKGGALQIFRAPFNSQSEALWNPTQRAIVINANHSMNQGSIVRSILFELHNALTEKELYQLDQQAYWGSITRNNYVASVEKIEYDNVIKTNALIDKAISQGYFSEESRWFTPGTFQEHLAMQIEFGHSQAIAASFDRLSSRTQ